MGSNSKNLWWGREVYKSEIDKREKKNVFWIHLGFKKKRARWT